MKIEHIALWTQDLEKSREFYSKFFGAIAGEKYVNPTKGFSSYFLSFDSGCRLEIMKMDGVNKTLSESEDQRAGISHFAVSVGIKAVVDSLTETLREAGYVIAGEPRQTGDGYYESVVLDPDGNRVEITI